MKVGDEVVVRLHGEAIRLQKVSKVSPTGSVITLDDGTRWRENGQRKEGENSYRLRIEPADANDRVYALQEMVKTAVATIHPHKDRPEERLRAALAALK